MKKNTIMICFEFNSKEEVESFLDQVKDKIKHSGLRINTKEVTIEKNEI